MCQGIKSNNLGFQKSTTSETRRAIDSVLSPEEQQTEGLLRTIWHITHVLTVARLTLTCSILTMF